MPYFEMAGFPGVPGLQALYKYNKRELATWNTRVVIYLNYTWISNVEYTCYTRPAYKTGSSPTWNTRVLIYLNYTWISNVEYTCYTRPTYKKRRLPPWNTRVPNYVKYLNVEYTVISRLQKSSSHIPRLIHGVHHSSTCITRDRFDRVAPHF
jgi:hypothetical protein